MSGEFDENLKNLVDKFVNGEITESQVKKKIDDEIRKLVEGGVKSE